MNESKKGILVIIEELETELKKLENDSSRISSLISSNMLSAEDIQIQQEKQEEIKKKIININERIKKIKEILAISFKKTIEKMSEEGFNKFVENQIAAMELEVNEELVEFESKPENKKVKLMCDLGDDIRNFNIQQVHSDNLKYPGKLYFIIKNFGIDKFKAELLEAKKYYESKPDDFQFIRQREEMLTLINQLFEFLTKCEEIIKKHSSEIESMGLKDPDYYISKVLDSDAQFILQDGKSTVLISNIMNLSKIKEIIEKRGIKFNPEQINIDEYNYLMRLNPLEQAHDILNGSIDDCPSYEEAVEYSKTKETIRSKTSNQREKNATKIEMLKTKDRKKIISYFISATTVSAEYKMEEREREYKHLQEILPLVKKFEEKKQNSEGNPIRTSLEKISSKINEVEVLSKDIKKIWEIGMQIRDLIDRIPHINAMLKIAAELDKKVDEKNALLIKKRSISDKMENLGEIGIFNFGKAKEYNLLEKEKGIISQELEKLNGDIRSTMDLYPTMNKDISDFKFAVDELRKVLKNFAFNSRKIDGMADIFAEYRGNDYKKYLEMLLVAAESIISEKEEEKSILLEETENPTQEEKDSLDKNSNLRIHSIYRIDDSVLGLDTKTAEELETIFSEYGEELSEEELEKVSSRGTI